MACGKKLMRYHVIWSDEAIDDLGRIWTDAADRNEVTRAQFVVDEGLERNPLTFGAELSEGLYACQVEPLRVYYDIDAAKKTVNVTCVRRSDGQGND
jgi:hypothetical protein